MRPVSNNSIAWYMRHADGESIDDIATREGVPPVFVEKSIADGARFENQRIALRVQHLRDLGAIENEEFRTKVRESFGDKILEALGTLLKGKSTTIQRDKSTGIVTLVEYDDPKLLIQAINLYRKTVSLEEKPAATTVIQTNIQQNNTQTNVSHGAQLFDFETEVEKLRKQQRASHEGRLIEAEATDPSEGA